MMLRDIYATRKPVFSFEFFPPKTPEAEESLFENALRLRDLGPSFFSMTYGAGGSTREKTLDLSRKLHDRTGVETVCHLTCVGQSKDEVRAILREMKSHGMQNVMALRGDPPRGVEKWEPHPDGFHYAAELVREIHKIGEFSVAVAGFPEMHPESTERDLDHYYLKQKVDAGADVVVTQLFFDNEDFFRYVDDLKRIGVTVPVVPGVMPIVSAQQVRRFCAMCKARIPDHLDRRLDEVADSAEATRELSVDYATRQIRELLDHGVPGVHIYCLNRSELSAEIFARLGLDRRSSVASASRS